MSKTQTSPTSRPFSQPFSSDKVNTYERLDVPNVLEPKVIGLSLAHEWSVDGAYPGVPSEVVKRLNARYFGFAFSGCLKLQIKKRTAIQSTLAR